MEKITQISINSVLFSLEDTAYTKLSQYLHEIRAAFKEETGGQEILKDIEARIAEHLKNRNEPVVTAKAVDEIIATMGTVAELTGRDDAEAKKPLTDNTEHSRSKRRLYRDEDKAILGGVCAGIAAYLEVDPTWVRIAFVALMFFGFGLIIPIYIILWLIIPPASTTAEKLEMHGNPVTLHTIVDTVRERAQDIYGQKACEEDGEHKSDRCSHDSARRLRERIRNIAARIANACGVSVRIFVGVLLTITGFGMIIGSAAATTALLTVDRAAEVQEFMAYAHADMFFNIAVAALALLIAIPGIFIFFGGLTILRKKAIVQIRYGLAIFGIWMLALTAIVVMATHFGIRFEKFRQERRNDKIQMEVREIVPVVISPNLQAFPQN